MKRRIIIVIVILAIVALMCYGCQDVPKEAPKEEQKEYRIKLNNCLCKRGTAEV